MTIKAAKGVFDIIPNPVDSKDSWKDSEKWIYVESMIRSTAQDYGFKEIRTPLFERTELFKRGVGEGTDIVNKEMYTFEDKGKRSMTLRPEGTAAVMRCVIEQQLYQQLPVQKYYYIGPMFRYERPQAGRYRQHHQFGVEAIGNKTPEQDVEIIDLIYTLYQRLGLQKLTFYLNSVGDNECRNKYREAFKNYLTPYLAELSAESQSRFQLNPLRILDSKDPNDRKILQDAPSILDFLSEECEEHFHQVCSLLDKLGIPFELNPALVRGLDYYSRTVYEIVAGELGAQNSIGGGGRFDRLIQSLGGQDTPATGFATGIERIIQTMEGQGATFPQSKRATCFFIPLGDKAIGECLLKTQELRRKGIFAEMDCSGRKLKHSMRYANSVGVHFVVVLGENEMESGRVELKDMWEESPKSLEVEWDNLSEEIEQYNVLVSK